MLQTPFLLIKNRITEVFNVGQGNATIQEVLLDAGQFEDGTKLPNVDHACMIHFQPVFLKNLGNGVQEAILNFQLKLFSEKAVYNDGAIKDDVLSEHHGLVNELYRSFTSYKAKYSDVPNVSIAPEDDYYVLSDFVRSSYVLEIQGDYLVTIQTFKVNFKDKLGTTVYTPYSENVTLDLTTNIR